MEEIDVAESRLLDIQEWEERISLEKNNLMISIFWKNYIGNKELGKTGF